MNTSTLINDTYEIIEEIGSGGGGAVYKAFHTRLKTFVVLKKIHANIVNKIDIRAEVDILKNLKHTYLPQVFDFLEIDGDVYTVIDFIEGNSFDKLLSQNQKFSQKDIVKWLGQVAEAVEYLHNQTPPIIHGDIKPANVMLTKDGNICLIDFNISQTQKEGDIIPLGFSHGYAAPEQYTSSMKDSITEYYNTNNKKKKKSKQKQSKIVDDNITKFQESVIDNNETKFQPTGLGENNETAFDGSVSESSSKKVSQNVNSKLEYVAKINQKTDIYAIGASFYHIVTGKKPDYSVLDNLDIKNVKNVSNGLKYIFEKSTAYLPENRFENAMLLKKSIENIYKFDKEYKKVELRRIVSIILSIAMIAGFSATCVYGYFTMQKEIDIKFDTLIADANVSYNENNFENSINLSNEACKVKSNEVEGYTINVKSLYSQKKYDECIYFAENVLNNITLNIETDVEKVLYSDIFYIIANCYFELDNYSDATVYMEKAIEYNDNNINYYRDLDIIS